MVLDLAGGLFKQSDVRETATADLISGQKVPVGAILAWWKSNAKTPSIPSGFVECNGQVLSDAESVFDGETLPALNNNNRFLRGNVTSGGTGGSSTHTLITAEMPAHTHQIGSKNYDIERVGDATRKIIYNYPEDYARTTTSTGGDGAHENKPPYFNVVWIIRIK